MTETHHNLVGLARVSTDAQDAQLQQDALDGAGCGRTFTEKVSTRKTDRPGLAAALDYVRPGDTLCVWKLDRLGRSTLDVLTVANDLHKRGIGVRILTGKLAGDYSPTGEGKFFFTMMAAFGELERDINHERTMAGLAAARAQGHIGGRKPKLTDSQAATVKRMHAAQDASGRRLHTAAEIAETVGVHRTTVYDYLKRSKSA